MPQYYIWTIGCQMNKAESEKLGRFLEQQDYRQAGSPDDADLIILNSCVVRDSAENRVINKLAFLKRWKKAGPGKVLALTGCLVNGENTALKKKFPHIDHFFQPGALPSWLEPKAVTIDLPDRASPSVFMPIIQGCNNFCSYCIVPYRRGRELSRPLPEITCEAKALAARGAREFILLGQNVDSYGHDLPVKIDLADLLTELNGTDGLARIRFLTNHPKDISPRLMAAMARLDKVCEQISLPVQSGSDAVLRAMRRGYTVAHYREITDRLRREVPGIAISTDIIVGFPGETESQFQETVDLLAAERFAAVHVAAYSARPGTIAARELTDNVPPAEKKRRLDIIEQMQERIATELNARLQDETVEVLVEGEKQGKWWGRTRTDRLVFFHDDSNRLGQLVPVKITQTSPWSLQGNPVCQVRREKVRC